MTTHFMPAHCHQTPTPQQWNYGYDSPSPPCFLSSVHSALTTQKEEWTLTEIIAVVRKHKAYLELMSTRFSRSIEDGSKSAMFMLGGGQKNGRKGNHDWSGEEFDWGNSAGWEHAWSFRPCCCKVYSLLTQHFLCYLSLDFEVNSTKKLCCTTN